MQGFQAESLKKISLVEALHGVAFLLFIFIFHSLQSMKNFRRLSLLASVVMFSVVMIASQGMLDTAYSEKIETPTASDSVGDIHVRAIFDMSDHRFVVDNFKVFDQKAGFNGLDHSVNTKPIIELWGAPDPSHMGLYVASDIIHTVGMRAISQTSPEFDAYIEIYQGETVLRAFDYNDCMVTNYVFTTLHDGDETFSGKTQFVYADVFELECLGYMPVNPLFENYQNDKEKASTESSSAWKGKQRSTWSDEFKQS